MHQIFYSSSPTNWDTTGVACTTIHITQKMNCHWRLHTSTHSLLEGHAFPGPSWERLYAPQAAHAWLQGGFMIRLIYLKIFTMIITQWIFKCKFIKLHLIINLSASLHKPALISASLYKLALIMKNVFTIFSPKLLICRKTDRNPHIWF